MALHYDIDYIIHYIKNSFEGYFEGLKFSEELNCFINKRIQASYNHELDCKKDDIDVLTERYKYRIEFL